MKSKEKTKPNRLMNTMEDRLNTMSNVFQALGDPTRLRLMRLLASNMEDRGLNRSSLAGKAKVR